MVIDDVIREKIGLIENSHLKLRKKVELVLIFAGEKPATDLIFSEKYRTVEGKPVLGVDVQIVKNLKNIINSTNNLLEKIGAAYYSELIQENEYREERIYTAKNISYLHRLINAVKKMDKREMGMCYGYHETAIEAFMGEREKEKLTSYDTSMLGYFNYFIHSIEFRREEDKTAERWHDTIKKLSLKLYRKIVEWQENYKKVLT